MASQVCTAADLISHVSDFSDCQHQEGRGGGIVGFGGHPLHQGGHTGLIFYCNKKPQASIF